MIKNNHSHLLLAALLVVVCLTAGSCTSSGPRPNIVIIIMDTVRQDHVSAYGYHRDTTPYLRELTAESTLYREAYSVSSWTAPAHASLFTGLHPAAHGCTQENWTMDENLETLAELLSRNGYRTVGITENPTIAGNAGFGQGFDTYHEAWRPADYGDENPAIHFFHQFMAERDGDRPFFLFVNFIEPHAPYNSSREFRDTFVDSGDGPILSLSRDHYLGRVHWEEPDLEQFRGLYDAEILYTDHQLRRLAERLQQEGEWEDTIFIVTSDHGENIGDHGHMDHYFSLYESTVKIPMLVRYPTIFPAGAEDTDPAQLTDLFPTILRHLQLDTGDAQGIDLLEAGARANRPVLCEYYWPAQALMSFQKDWDDEILNRWKRSLRATILGGKKLIWASDGKHELYDLAADPEELNDLSTSPDLARDREALASLIDNLIRRYRVDGAGGAVTGGPELDEETEEALRSLGYIE